MKRFAPLAAFFGLVLLSYSFSVAQDAFRGVTNLHGTYGNTGGYQAHIAKTAERRRSKCGFFVFSHALVRPLT